MIEQPVLVQPESAPLSKCSITVGNRDSWKLIAEAEIAVDGERYVNLAIRKLLPQVRHKTLVQIRKTDSHKSLLVEIRLQSQVCRPKAVKGCLLGGLVQKMECKSDVKNDVAVATPQYIVLSREKAYVRPSDDPNLKR